MHTGMLWFDNNPKVALKDKIEKAIAYYRKKYNHEPNLCLIHPSMMDHGELDFDEMTVRAYRPVLPGHLWIGVEDRN